MFRVRKRYRLQGALPRKIAGLALAVAGVAIIADKVPPAMWWFLLGLGLIGLGWRLFTG